MAEDRAGRELWKWAIVAFPVLLGLSVGAYCLDYFEFWHDPSERLPRLNGSRIESVIAELGEPSRQTEFTMGDCCNEFTIGLYNTYNPGDPETAHVRIRELQWDRKRYKIAVWLHQVDGVWVVLDTLRWQDGIEF